VTFFMVELPVSDLAKSIAWYVVHCDAVLKLDDSENGFALLHCGKTRIALKAGAKLSSNACVHFEVASLDSAVARMKRGRQEMHGSIKSSAEGYRRAKYLDPDGTTIILFERQNPLDSMFCWRQVLVFLGLAMAGCMLLALSIGYIKAEIAKTDKVYDDVRSVLDRQVVDWNAGRLEGFMEGYWKSDDLEFISGDKTTKGWQATFDRYEKRYRADGKEMGELTFGDVQVFVNKNRFEAVVTGTWKLTMKDGTMPHGKFRLTMRPIDGAWRIVRDETTSEP